MRNLAGLPTDEANAAIIEELASAGIDAVPVPLDAKYREVRSTFDGVLCLGARTFAFRRAWVYWIVSATPALTLGEAEYIDEWPAPEASGTQHSGNRGTLGDVVRCDGYAGGRRPRDFPRSATRSFDNWHVDTRVGLAGLVEALAAQFGGAA